MCAKASQINNFPLLRGQHCTQNLSCVQQLPIWLAEKSVTYSNVKGWATIVEEHIS